jgi:hypothetical protein
MSAAIPTRTFSLMASEGTSSPRLRRLFTIKRNSNFAYKGKVADGRDGRHPKHSSNAQRRVEFSSDPMQRESENKPRIDEVGFVPHHNSVEQLLVGFGLLGRDHRPDREGA